MSAEIIQGQAGRSDNSWGIFQKLDTALGKTSHLSVVGSLVLCSIVYYLGELLDMAALPGHHWSFLDGVHDVQRILFLVPILLAARFFGARGVWLTGIASFLVFLPRALVISGYPDPVLRPAFTSIVMLVTGLVTAANRTELDRLRMIAGRIQRDSDASAWAERTRKIVEREVFSAGELEVDFPRQLVTLRGQVIKLTPTEYKLLAYMVKNNGRVLSHLELLRNVWGPEYGQEAEYLRTYVSQLRHKIEDDPTYPRFLITEPGAGYVFRQT